MSHRRLYDARCSKAPTLRNAFPALEQSARHPLSAALAMLLITPLHAATIVVDNASGSSVTGACTLRDAVISANTHAQAPGSHCVAGNGSNDTIIFDASVADIVFSTAAPATSSALAVSEVLTIDGGTLTASGTPRVTIERSTAAGTPNFRLVESNSDLTLKNLILAHANAGALNGGAILMTAASTLSISGSVINDNHSTGTLGGAIYSRALDIDHSTISGNSLATANACAGGALASSTVLTLTSSKVSGNSGICSAIHGGAVYATTVNITDSIVSDNLGQSTGVGSIGLGGGVYGLTVNLTNSTIARNRLLTNTVNALGGGVLAHSGSMTNSTVTGNSTNGKGAGIYLAGSFNIYFSTITQNSTSTAGAPAGASLGSSAHVRATASIFFGNTGGADIDGGFSTVTLAGDHDLIGTHGSMVTLVNSALSCDPKLGPLGDNGGPTPTRGLLNGSCAIDAGPTSPSTPVTDQRGGAHSRVVAMASDIGAFEKQSPADPDLIFADAFEF